MANLGWCIVSLIRYSQLPYQTAAKSYAACFGAMTIKLLRSSATLR